MESTKGLYNTPINRHWKRKKVTFEPSIVETAGVIPPKVQIERLIQAGERLVEYRKENYDYHVGSPVNEADPDIDIRVRQPNIDMAEVDAIKESVDENMKKALKNKERQDKIRKDKELSNEQETKEDSRPDSTDDSGDK